MRRALSVAVLLLLAGCGGDEQEAVPVDWCNNTGQLIYLLDQHSTTMDTEQVRDWAEAAPENVRPAATDMATALRRYPVDAKAPDLVAAREEVEEFARERCQEDWEGPNRYSG